jgi:hypothetical protein
MLGFFESLFHTAVVFGPGTRSLAAMSATREDEEDKPRIVVGAYSIRTFFLHDHGLGAFCRCPQLGFLRMRE